MKGRTETETESTEGTGKFSGFDGRWHPRRGKDQFVGPWVSSEKSGREEGTKEMEDAIVVCENEIKRRSHRDTVRVIEGRRSTGSNLLPCPPIVGGYLPYLSVADVHSPNHLLITYWAQGLRKVLFPQQM